MRELIFLVILSFISEHVSSTSLMLPMLKTHSEDNGAFLFLFGEECQSGQTSTNLYLNDKTIQYKDLASCDDTIGFLPLPDNTIKVFVSATLQDITRTLEKLELNFRVQTSNQGEEKLIYECSKQQIGLVTDFSNIFTNFEKTGEFLNINGPQNTDETNLKVIGCEGIKIKMDNLNNMIGYWSMKKTYSTSAQEKLEGQIADVKELQKRVRCDPDKLILRTLADDTKETKYEAIDSEPTDKKVQLVNFKNNKLTEMPYPKTKVNSGQCTQGFTFIAKVNDGKAKVTTGVECVQDGATKLWNYKVFLPQLPGVAGGTPTDVPPDVVPTDQKVEVACRKLMCRTCTLEAHPPFKPDVSPTVVIQNNMIGDIDACYHLNTDECKAKIIILNDQFVKFDPVDKTYCDGGKYNINGEDVKTIACSDKYSAQASSIVLTEPTTLKEPVKSAEARDCQLNITHGCYCQNVEDLGKLAIVKKDGKEYLGVDSVKFDQQTNEWIYSRKINETESRVSLLEKGRSVRCISSEVAPLKDIPNPSKSIVYIVNIVLIAILLAAVIPGVIFYVNARVKKREALKAEKMGKKKKGGDDKKEEQSGEKKDEEKKNSEEKKNEA